MKTEKYYNAEVKEKYFETFQNEATKEATEYSFKKTKNTEEDFKKDIYEMNIDELGEVVKGFEASTIDSAYNYAFRLQYYIDWAIKNGYSKTNISPFSTVDDMKKWVEPFVATFKKSLFTRNEILDMCEYLVNYQDKAILLSLFEGIAGEGYSEILNLKIQDIKEINNQYFATLKDKSGKMRTIKISDRLYKYLFEANNEEVYFNKNGESDSTKSSKSILVDSPYIFKKSSRGKKDGELDAFFVRRKIQLFKELFDSTYLTAKEIANSGMLHMVNEFYKEYGTISEEKWEEIADQYDTPYIKYKDHQYRNTLILKKKASEKIFEQKYGYCINELV